MRRHVIGRVFRALGLIEQWGSGVQRMARACREAGLAAPVFEEIGTRFRVTLFTARVAAPALEETGGGASTAGVQQQHAADGASRRN